MPAQLQTRYPIRNLATDSIARDWTRGWVVRALQIHRNENPQSSSMRGGASSGQSAAKVEIGKISDTFQGIRSLDQCAKIQVRSVPWPNTWTLVYYCTFRLQTNIIRFRARFGEHYSRSRQQIRQRCGLVIDCRQGCTRCNLL